MRAESLYCSPMMLSSTDGFSGGAVEFGEEGIEGLVVVHAGGDQEAVAARIGQDDGPVALQVGRAGGLVAPGEEVARASSPASLHRRVRGE